MKDKKIFWIIGVVVLIMFMNQNDKKTFSTSQCHKCGDGFTNICDEQECLSLGNCKWDGPIHRSCSYANTNDIICCRNLLGQYRTTTVSDCGSWGAISDNEKCLSTKCSNPIAIQNRYTCKSGYVYQCENGEWVSGGYICGHSDESGDCKYGNNIVKEFGGKELCELKGVPDIGCNNPLADDNSLSCNNQDIFMCDNGNWNFYKSCLDYGTNYVCKTKTSDIIGDLCGCNPNCDGKVCGNDGCGGSCGICKAGSCSNGQCTTDGGEEGDICPDTKEPKEFYQDIKDDSCRTATWVYIAGGFIVFMMLMMMMKK